MELTVTGKTYCILLNILTHFRFEQNAQIKLVLAVAKGSSLIRISVQKLDFRTELKMINGPSVYDSGGPATTRPDFKAFFDKFRPSCQNHIQPEKAEWWWRDHLSFLTVENQFLEGNLLNVLSCYRLA